MRLILFVILSLTFSSLYGQSYRDKTNVSEKVKKPYRKGLEFMDQGDYEKSIGAFSTSIKLCPTFIDAYYYRGGLYYELNQLANARMDLLKVVELNPKYKPKVLYTLGTLEWKMNEFDVSIEHLNQFVASEFKSTTLKNKASRLLENVKFAKKAVEDPLSFDPQPMSNAINTDLPEYLPSFTADGNQLIFTRVINGQEDFYITEKKDGQWITAEPIRNINTPGNEAAQTVSADGRVIIFTACGRREGFGSCDLYIAEFINGAWTAPRNMGPGVNSYDWDSQPSLTADGQFLYFTSKRKGGQGGTDIYICKRFEDGIWSKPVNLGPSVNTPYADESPFIHADGKTLYFMSTGYPGMGDYDLYMVRQEQSFKWGEVRNLGYPINTKGKEGALVVSLDGTRGYYAHEGKSENNYHDIYEFELPEPIRPDPVTYVKGKVIHAHTGNPILASVKLFKTGNEKSEQFILTDNEGNFLVCLPIGATYSLTVDKPGYTFYSDRFELAKSRTIDKPFLLEIPLQELKVLAAASSNEEEIKTEPIILKNVLFETASAELLEESSTELDRLFQMMQEAPDTRIQISGHTDDVGNDEDNLLLSENRAKAVYTYLVNKGIDKKRMQSKGFGETQPIADNTTDEGRSLNRRTEFVILN
ncbi:MAG: PD40 domain-containing protein [Bacteroidia bacterium]|nr:PD40 domain-containing protein [Bacteroidia bacterium]